MLQFVDFTQASSIIDEKQINTFLISVSLDDMKTGTYFKALANKFPDFESKFDKAVSARNNWRTSNIIKVKLDSGHTIYSVIGKSVDKYALYILDLVNGIRNVYDQIRKEYQDLDSCRVLTFIPTSEELKLSDAIAIPSLVDALNDPEIQTWGVSSGDHEKYVEKITPKAVYYKPDSWQGDWMLGIDDLIFIEALATAQAISPNIKLNKSVLAKTYYTCHQAGRFQKIEFYQTEFGPFFKLFMAKAFGLNNHSILINVHHHSRLEPPRFSCMFGPGYSYLKFLAYSKLAEHKNEIITLAKEIVRLNFEAYKERAEATKSGGDFKPTSQPTPSKLSL